MLFKTIKNQIAKHGLTEDLIRKIDVFYLAGRLTEEEYKALIGVPDDADPADGGNTFER